MDAMAPTKTTRSGTVKVVDKRNFPVSKTIAAALVTIQPGGLRELHWHPNADEWQYYIKGNARMTVFNTGPQAQTADFRPGDIGYVKKSLGHYVQNTGSTELQFLEIFKADRFAEGLAGTMACLYAAGTGRRAPEDRPVFHPADLEGSSRYRPGLTCVGNSASAERCEAESSDFATRSQTGPPVVLSPASTAPWAESACLRARLPQSRNDSAVTVSDTSNHELSNRPTILLVEDDQDLAGEILANLKQHRYAAKHAATGLQGLEAMRASDADLLIADRMLPELDGLSLIETAARRRDPRPRPGSERALLGR